MAKQPIGVGAKFTADSSGFEKAAVNIGKSTKAIKRDIRDSASVMDELGGAVGGVGGEITSMVSRLATASGPIALLTAVIGGLAIAWKRSQENVDLYLKSADKVKFGFAGYAIDAETARADVRRRAHGQITEGERNIGMASVGLGRPGATAEQKEIFRAQKEAGLRMRDEGRLLMESVTGYKDKVAWTQKYNKLLQEQEILNDTELANQTKWEALEAKLVEQRTIIQDKESKAKDKKVAINEAEKIANQLLKEKNTFIDRQLSNMIAISEMTATQEVIEKARFGLERQKNTNIKEYQTDLLKVLRMETRIKDVIEKRQSLSKVGTGGLSAGKFGSMPSLPGLRGGPVQAANELNEALFEEINVVQTLQGTFEGMFSSIGGGFKGMADSLIESVRRIAVELAAKAAVFMLLKVLFPGLFIGMDLYKAGSFGKFLGIPAMGGGASSAGSSITGGSILLQGNLQGRDIFLSGARYGNMVNKNT
jgi:hypothetical protein